MSAPPKPVCLAAAYFVKIKNKIVTNISSIAHLKHVNYYCNI